MIVDPHNFHLGDALAKLRGLAGYAEQHGSKFHRIEAVAEVKGGTPRVLDLNSDYLLIQRLGAGSTVGERGSDATTWASSGSRGRRQRFQMASKAVL